MRFKLAFPFAVLAIVSSAMACNSILGNDSWTPLGGDGSTGDGGPGDDGSGGDGPGRDGGGDGGGGGDGQMGGDADAMPPTGTVLGVETFGKGAGATGSAMATNSKGEIAIGITYHGDITVGMTSVTEQGMGDFIVAKLDPSGTMLWAKSFGTAAAEDVAGVAIDSAGAVYVTGSFFGPNMAFGSTMLTRNAGYRDMYVAKLDGGDGHVDWAVGVGGAGDKTPARIVADNTGAGSVIVGGLLSNGPIVIKGVMSGGNGEDGFLIKFAADGTTSWGYAIDGGGDDYVTTVAVDLGGDVALGGGFTSMFLPIGPGSPPPLARKGNDHDAFVAKVSGVDGSLIWGKNYGNAYYPDVTATAFTSTGELWVAGFFVTQNLDFGNGMTLSSKGDGSRNIFLLRLTKDMGATLFARSIGGELQDGGTGGGDENALSLAVDSTDTMLLAGSFQSNVLVFDKPITNSGPPDGFFVSMGPLGKYHQSRGVGGPKPDAWGSIAAGAGDAVIGFGTFAGKVDFGTGMPITSVNGADNAYLIRIAP